MALDNIDNVKTASVSPPPIHDRILENNRPTVTFIRYLQDLRANNGDVYKEINKVIDQVNLNINEINSLQEEVDRVETASGLDSSGNYIQPTGTNYIDGSTTLTNADEKLDSAIVLTDSRQKVLNKSADYQALNENQIIIVDTTSIAVNITLPNPTTFNDGTYSKTIGIFKQDSTRNKVNILPFASELIVGEASQYLALSSEVLNFVSDGTNWILGN